jgi:serine/threonine protein phosphatase PrpC
MEQQHDGPSFPSIRSHTAAIRGALRKIEREVLRDDDLEFQGSTCVAVLVHTAEDGSRTLLSANVGDSRAVLSRGGKAVDLTRDHKPSDEKERARIRSMGEDVQWDPWGQIYRVRDLSLSRAIGDRFAKPIVSSEAEITQESIRDDEDEFFLLASDGLFDVMTSQEVVDFVRECLRNEPEFEEMYGKLKFAPSERREHMAEILANEALERGSADNVCVIVVWLKDLD